MVGWQRGRDWFVAVKSASKLESGARPQAYKRHKQKIFDVRGETC